MKAGRRILISPMDWGLGHTTRIVPIIRALKEKGHDVTVALNDRQKVIILEEFPSIKTVYLSGYNIEYSLRSSMAWSLIKQTKKILEAIKLENQWLENYIEENPQDIIVSDNRFGFYHPRVESIYITHQINIQGPSVIKPFLYGLHKNYIDNFHHCWIPDNEDSLLSGMLSKTGIERFRFIGPLSRFEISATNDDLKYDYLGIVSGPEPQRSVFCAILEREFKASGKRCAIIGGVPLEKEVTNDNNLIYFPHLNTDDFYKIVCQSEQVIARSGYSTIMDFSILQKPIFFVPTPGQTEQEYLAEYHKENSGIGNCAQNQFKLSKVKDSNKLPVSKPTNWSKLDIEGSTLF